MKTKLHKSDINKIRKIDPNARIFEAVRSSKSQIKFFCPNCAKHHYHGISPQFEPQPKSAHCNNPNAEWYFVFWNGKSD